jgi:FtsP/CotA-like multicopper oxidase with cupredoxin domain
MISRRHILSRIGLGSLAALVASVAQRARARDAHEGHAMPAMPAPAPAEVTPAGSARQPASSPAAGYTPVRTLNGWTLPHTMKDGVKEFHLVAEELSTSSRPAASRNAGATTAARPGPTIEAVEGDRVRIFVTNRLPEHTTIHWHGLCLPSGMDGVGGLNQPHIQPGETFVYEFTLRAARHATCTTRMPTRWCRSPWA